MFYNKYAVYLDNTDTLPGRVGGLKMHSRHLLRIVLVTSSLRVERNVVVVVQFATTPAPFVLTVGLVCIVLRDQSLRIKPQWFISIYFIKCMCL
jgi:hypothetical protein